MGLTRILLLVTLLAGSGMALRVAFDDDEFQHLHMAWLIGRGEVPHRDFFEHHTPLYHVLMAPLTLGNAGPGRILAARGVSVVMLVATLGLAVVTLRRRLGAAPVAVLAWCAFSPIFFVKMVEVRPEALAILLAFGCLALLAAPSPRLAAAGLLAGAMVCTSQKFIFLAAGLTLCALRGRSSREAVRFVIGGAVCPLLLLAAYAVTGALPGAWAHLVVMNTGWQESFSPAMYGNLLWTTSGVLSVFALAALLPGEHTDARLDTAILLAAGLAGVLAVPIPFRQTWLMLYPGLVLGAAITWQRLAAAWPDPRTLRTAGWTLTLAALLPALAEIEREARTTLQDDMTLMRTLDRDTLGPVFDGRGLVFWRRHVGYYPWLHEGLMLMLDPDDYTRETIAAIRAAGYPNVLLDYRVDYMPESLRNFLIESTVPVDPAPLRVPGVRIDRARLAGEGSTFTLPVAGLYRVSWRGGQVFLNGAALESGDTLDLEPGPHHIRGQGFVRALVIARVEDPP